MSTPFNAQTLAKILGDIKPGLRKEDIDTDTALNLSHFVFTGDRVLTTDKVVLISAPFETDFQCSVLAESFFAAVSAAAGLGAGEISLEDTNLLVVADGVDAKIPIKQDYNLDLLLKQMQLVDLEWKPLPSDFTEGLDLCNFSTSTNESLNLSCVLCTGAHAISCDGKRVSKFTFDSVIEDKILIDRKKVKELKNFPIIEYAVTDFRAHFRTEDGVIFSTGVRMGKYHNTDPFFVCEGPSLVLPRNKLKAALKNTMPILVDDTMSRPVEITTHRALLTLKASGPRGSLIQEIELENKSPDCEFLINPKFLIDILERSITCIVGPDRVLFNREDGKFLHCATRSIGGKTDA